MNHDNTRRALAGTRAIIMAVALAAGNGASAQDAARPDPRAAQPERPSVATHAFTVAPGIIEIEAGFQRQRPDPSSTALAVPVLLKVGLSSGLQLDIAPGWIRAGEDGAERAGIADLAIGVKWRLADQAPVLGAFALQPTISLPTGSRDRGTGAGTAVLNLLVISSHTLRGVALDVNAGYSRRGGDGDAIARHATSWAAASGIPVAGPLNWVAEIFGYPGTAGPAGEAPVVGFLTGPTFTLSSRLIADAGAILSIGGFGGTAVYAGLTWNAGCAWTPEPRD